MPLLKKKKGETVPKQTMRTAMHEFKGGKLRSGSKTGPKVTNKKQAIAIGLSEARKAGDKSIPKPPAIPHAKKWPGKAKTDNSGEVNFMMQKKRKARAPKAV